MLLLKNMSTIEHVEKRDPTKKDQVNPFDLGKEKNWVQVPCLSTCVHSETNMYAHMRIASRTLCCLLFFGMLHHATARARRHTHLTHTHTHTHTHAHTHAHTYTHTHTQLNNVNKCTITHTHTHTRTQKVFGTNPWLWPFPVGQTVGDGVHWETNENLQNTGGDA